MSNHIAADLRPLAVPVSSLVPDDDNPIHHTQDDLAETQKSLQENGQVESAPDSLPPKKPKKLTDKELAWANAYLETFNKTEAARQAKYKGNDSTLAHIGWENYRKAHIQAYLRQRSEEVAGMSKEETLRLLGDQARFDPLQYARIISDQRGQWFYIDLIALKEAGLGHLVKELGYDKEGRPIVKFHDAQAAQIQLGKVNGALTTAGESDDKPFIIKVTYGQRTNGSTEEPTS